MAFGIALLIALLAAGYFLVQYIVGVFAALEPQTRILAAVASGTALLSAGIVAEALRARGQRDRQVGAEKVALYERVLSSCCEPERASVAALQASDEALAAMERTLALQGSAKVITAYARFRRLTRSGELSTDTHVDLLNSLVMAMRRDLGRSESVRASDLSELLAGRTSSSSQPPLIAGGAGE